MNYISNTINKTFKNKYHKDTLKIAINMAWPAIIESFFIAFAGHCRNPCYLLLWKGCRTPCRTVKKTEWFDFGQRKRLYYKSKTKWIPQFSHDSGDSGIFDGKYRILSGGSADSYHWHGFLGKHGASNLL